MLFYKICSIKKNENRPNNNNNFDSSLVWASPQTKNKFFYVMREIHHAGTGIALPLRGVPPDRMAMVKPYSPKVAWVEVDDQVMKCGFANIFFRKKTRL